MFQVIRKQQHVIREQGKVIQTLGGKYEDFDGIEFVNRMSKLKKEKHVEEHVKIEESDEGRTISSLHDSVLDESAEDPSLRTEKMTSQVTIKIFLMSLMMAKILIVMLQCLMLLLLILIKMKMIRLKKKEKKH